MSTGALRDFLFSSLATKSVDPLTTDGTNLAIVFISSFTFFWLCYIVADLVFKHGCKWNVAYNDLKSDKKADYLSRVVANIHAVLSCVAAILSFLYTW